MALSSARTGAPSRDGQFAPGAWLAHFRPGPTARLGEFLDSARLLGLPVAQGAVVAGTGASAAMRARHIVAALERRTSRRLGDPARPLLLTAQDPAAGAALDNRLCIPCLGCTREVAAALAERDRPDGWAMHARLIRAFARNVRGLSPRVIRRLADETGPDGEAFAHLIDAALGEHGLAPVPQDADRQLDEVVTTAPRWGLPSDPSAGHLLLRETLGITSAPVTAVGVACSRHPLSGDHGLQGECRLLGSQLALSIGAMANRYPSAHATLERALSLLEAQHRNVCVVEFVLTGDELHITSGSIGVPEVAAAVRILVDLVDEGTLAPEEALEQIPLTAMEDAQLPVVRPSRATDVLAHGTTIRPGSATGPLFFGPAPAATDRPIIVVARDEDDLAATEGAAAVLVADCGRGLGAARIARRHRRPSLLVPGGPAVMLDDIAEGEIVTVDATHGVVFRGRAEHVSAQPDSDIARVIAWCSDGERPAVTAVVPTGFARVRPHEHLPDADGYLVSLPTDASSQQWMDFVLALLRRGVTALAVPYTSRVAEIAPLLPPAPWTHVLAGPGQEWAAQVLAARLTVAPNVDGARRPSIGRSSL